MIMILRDRVKWLLEQSENLGNGTLDVKLDANLHILLQFKWFALYNCAFSCKRQTS